MNKTISSCIVFLLIALRSLYAQDVIILHSGDEINGKVLEIGLAEIRYKKASNPEGPTIVIAKSDVFMIKYKNGTKDVFESKEAPEPAPVQEPPANIPVPEARSEAPATVFFVRPTKYTLWAANFLVKTGQPDSTIAILKNGSYHQFVTDNIRAWEFTGDMSKWVQGLKKNLILKLEPGKTYYVQCSVREGFPRPKMVFETIPENEGRRLIEKYK